MILRKAESISLNQKYLIPNKILGKIYVFQPRATKIDNFSKTLLPGKPQKFPNFQVFFNLDIFLSCGSSC